MSSGLAERFERIIDAAASGTLAVAAGTCLLRLSVRVESSLAVAMLAFFGSFLLLRAVRPEARRYRLPDLVVAPLPVPPEELVLTEADRLPNDAPARAAELLLDDVLAELGPDSRVVRLFDRAAMPTPGELHARIDRHLNGERGPPAAADASEALHEALAELRRSLR